MTANALPIAGETFYHTPRLNPLLSETASFQKLLLKAACIFNLLEKATNNKETVTISVSESDLESKLLGDISKKEEADHRIVTKRDIDVWKAKNRRDEEKDEKRNEEIMKGNYS